LQTRQHYQEKGRRIVNDNKCDERGKSATVTEIKRNEYESEQVLQENQAGAFQRDPSPAEYAEASRSYEFFMSSVKDNFANTTSQDSFS